MGSAPSCMSACIAVRVSNASLEDLKQTLGGMPDAEKEKLLKALAEHEPVLTDRVQLAYLMFKDINASPYLDEAKFETADLRQLTAVIDEINREDSSIRSQCHQYGYPYEGMSNDKKQRIASCRALIKARAKAEWLTPLLALTAEDVHGIQSEEVLNILFQGIGRINSWCRGDINDEEGAALKRLKGFWLGFRRAALQMQDLERTFLRSGQGSSEDDIPVGDANDIMPSGGALLKFATDSQAFLEEDQPAAKQKMQEVCNRGEELVQHLLRFYVELGKQTGDDNVVSKQKSPEFLMRMLQSADSLCKLETVSAAQKDPLRAASVEIHMQLLQVCQHAFEELCRTEVEKLSYQEVAEVQFRLDGIKQIIGKTATKVGEAEAKAKTKEYFDHMIRSDIDVKLIKRRNDIEKEWQEMTQAKLEAMSQEDFEIIRRKAQSFADNPVPDSLGDAQYSAGVQEMQRESRAWCHIHELVQKVLEGRKA
eukprot:TRINITY_DN105366_c0_g1_i1.p1 TRINITY_DN105366_c0_g1~~TRINITY_DN105366_c0_g1_i1.p1  ORF type:complete len:481 (+),score=89.63 TRINITY_DN105366_c0_g1_i1:47-1489(+)